MKILVDLENAIVERIQGVDLGYTLKKVATYGGEFGQAVGDTVRGFPAVLTISKAGLPQKSFNSTVVLKATVTVFCCAENLRNEQAARHGATGKVGTYQIMEDVVTLLYGQTLGLPISPLQFSGWQPVMNDRIDGHLLSVYSLDFTTDITISAGVNPDTLDNFNTFHANWDVPPLGNVELELPADATADATDSVWVGKPQIILTPEVVSYGIGASTQTNHVTTAPAFIEDGHGLIQFIVTGRSSTPPIPPAIITLEKPGFEELFRVNYGTSLTVAAYWKIADNESGDYPFTTGQAFETLSIMLNIRNFGGIHKFDTLHTPIAQGLIFPTPEFLAEIKGCLIVNALGRQRAGGVPLELPETPLATVLHNNTTGLDTRTLAVSTHEKDTTGTVLERVFKTLTTSTATGITATIAIAPVITE